MASRVNRTAIILNLAAFVCVSVFCFSTQAPLIQQDILKRTQDTLLVHHIPIDGLTVDGRDVILTGFTDSAITNPNTQSMVAKLEGVRTARTKFVTRTPATGRIVDEPGNNRSRVVGNVTPAATSADQHDAQDRIDQLLQNQGITFKGETAIMTPDGELVLDKIAAVLAISPNLFCNIRGYDSQPREARQNWVLALQRALATEDYLAGKGIAIWRLSARAYEAGADTDGRRSDREVDVVVRAK